MASIDRNQQAEPSGAGEPALSQADDMVAAVLSRIPHSLIAFLGRFSIAAVFWKSGQTKVQGFAIDILEGRFELGIPHFADSTIDLFRRSTGYPSFPRSLPR